MTEIPEHLRKRAEEVRRQAGLDAAMIPEHLLTRSRARLERAGIGYTQVDNTPPPLAATSPPDPPQMTRTVRHEVATVVPRHEAPSTCYIVCTCGWVSMPVWLPDGITAAFHQHAHG